MNKFRYLYWCLAPIIILLGLMRCDTPQSLEPIQDRSFIKLFGGQQNQAGYDLIETSDGGFLLVGNSFSADDPNESDVFIVKTDRAGNETRSYYIDMTVNDITNDTVRAIVKGSGDEYAIIGTSTYTDGTKDVFFLKVNESGEQIGEPKLYEKPNTSEEAWDIVSAIDGEGYMIVGTTNDIDIAKYAPNGVARSTDVSDAYWIRVSENGEKIWEKRHGWMGVDQAKAIIPLPSQSSYAIAGTSDSLHIETSKADLNALIFLINQDGNIINASLYGSDTADESANDIVQTNDGSFIVTGNRTTSNGKSDIYLAELNLSLGLETRWEQTLGDDDKEDIGYSLSLMENGSILISGTTQSCNARGWDLFVFETNPQSNKNEFCPKTFGWAGTDFGARAILTTDNRIAIIGTIDFGTNTMMGLIKMNQQGILDT